MKKKLLSLLLVLTLALSLCAPAMAAGCEAEADPEWEAWKTEWLSAHPQEAAAFDPDAYFENNYEESGWYYSKEDFMNSYGLETKEEFDTLMRDAWLTGIKYEEEQQAWMDQYEAANPGAISGFDPDAWFMEHYYKDPKQRFMEQNKLDTQDEFKAYMLNDYVTGLQADQAQQKLIDQYEAAHPGAVTSFDADAYFSENYSWWGGGKEDYMQWLELETEEEFYNSMLDDMLESLAWTQSWQEERDQVVTELGGVPGQLGVMVDGTYLTFSPDKMPYAENGVTYVPADALQTALGLEVEGDDAGYAPLRPAAEAAGYDVGWDDTYQTAVLIGRAAVISEADGRFTVLNGLLKTWADKNDSAKNYKTDLSVTAEWTQFDSLDGDKSWSLSGSANVISGPDGVDMSGKYDFSSYLDILYSVNPYLAEYQDEEAVAQLEALVKGDFDLLIDNGDNTLYLRVPKALLPYFFALTGEKYAKEAWLSQSLEVEAQADAAPLEPTMGNLLYALSSSSYGWYSIYTYENLKDSVDSAARVIGDACFEQKDSNYVLSLHKEGLGLLLSEDDPEYYTEDIKEFSLTMTIKADGTVTGSVLFRPESYSYYIQDNQLSAEWTLTFNDASLDLEYHIKNQGKLHLTITGKSSLTSQTPVVTPPDTATVFPMDELGA